MSNTWSCILITITAGSWLLPAASIPGDAKLGQQLFRDQKCITCHSIRGEGGKSAPDLAARAAKDYTPTLMASLIWNHAPAMWQAMESAGIARPALSHDDAANLYAFFFANRYFEQPGDAGRGKALLEKNKCLDCHKDGGPGKAVASWSAASDPIELARQLWNHAPQMRTAMQGRKWPRLTAQDLSDLQVYIQSQPGARAAEAVFQPGPADTGEMIFQKKGCAGCHKGSAALEGKLSRSTLAQLAAAMWNHAPLMKGEPVELRPEEMRRMVGYLWSIQYFEAPGNAARGKGVFEKKQCASCHAGSGGAPNLASMAGKTDPMSIVSVLWRHGPDMLKAMNQKNVAWPRFEGRQMADLIAYVNTLK